MENEESILVKTIGMICLFIGLFLGVGLFFYGVVITLGTIILSATGYDATGLGIIVGPPMCFAGIILSCPLMLAKRLLHVKTKDIVLYALVVALIPVLFGMGGMISYKNQVDLELKLEEKLAKSRNDEILEKLKNSKYATVKVICNIRDNKIDMRDIETIQAGQRKFAVENIIQPLGSENISNYKFYAWGGYDIYFVADVTRAGYEGLKQNRHISQIELTDKK